MTLIRYGEQQCYPAIRKLHFDHLLWALAGLSMYALDLVAASGKDTQPNILAGDQSVTF